MSQQWYSNGKLMLTGEYMVLFGSKALAIPVKLGQSLKVIEEEGNALLDFSTEVLGKPWFNSIFNTNSFAIVNANNTSSACYLRELFIAARLLNPLFLRQRKKIVASAIIDFNIEWGLGSSSTLISNIAWWANVDPYELNRIVSMGSGYDIACARNKSAIFYSLTQGIPSIKQIYFNPKFSNKIWFVYLGNKLKTEVHLSETMENLNPGSSEIKEISAISEALLKAQTVSEFSPLIIKHESIISKILGEPTIQSTYFHNFKGTVKSLGAWGGDFCMAISEENELYVKEYFEQKGLRTVLSFNELVL